MTPKVTLFLTTSPVKSYQNCNDRAPHVSAFDFDNPYASGDYYSCDMERDARNDVQCQIRQDTSDQFDWSWRQGRTPTGASFDRRFEDGTRYPVTGPERAQSGTFFLYIEASGRRNDEVARCVTSTLYYQFRSLLQTMPLHIRLSRAYEMNFELQAY